MERWEALIEGCPETPDLRFFGKAIQTAAVVLKEDLAPFEIEWILQTLFYKPVEVIRTVKENCGDNLWSKAIGDVFKLFMELIGSCHELNAHFTDIVDLCLLPFEPRTRALGLQCCTRVGRVSSEGARDVARHVAALQDPQACRAPLAGLVGTICEYHPAMVTEDVNKIWRIFLNMLGHNKNTDTITASVLQAILGLLKHFGADLPTAELNSFYDQLVGTYLRIPRCEDVCLTILASHSRLFRERVSSDVRTRLHVWSRVQNTSRQADRQTQMYGQKALMAMYETCWGLNKDVLYKICTTELLPQVHSSISQVKYTSLRIMTHIQTNCDVTLDLQGHTDVHSLEFELRSTNVSYDVAEAVSFCLDTNVQNCENLLQAAMVFYTNLPSNRRKEIVVHSILKAPQELRSAAITFLTSETTVDASDRFSQLWVDLFDTDDGKDITVVENSRFVFEDFMGYCIFVVEAFIEEGGEKLPDRLTNLLTLTSQILSRHSKESYTSGCSRVLLQLWLRLPPDVAAIAAARHCLTHAGDDDEELVMRVCQTIHIDSCKDEALLCESCLMLIEAPSTAVDVDNVLKALRIIFSRNDVEAKTISKSLKKLENIIVNDKYKLDNISDIIQQIEKLNSRKDLTGKDARILRRDIILFLGKFGGHNKDLNNNMRIDNALIVKLKESFTLNLPNPEDGTSYKINLQRIIQLALEHEDPDSLHTLLVLICANLTSKKNDQLELVLARVCHALCRVASRGSGDKAASIQAAVTMCDSVGSVQAFLRYISEEKSPGVRKMLSDALEELLRRDQGDALVLAVNEHASVMMGGGDATMKRAGLDITETLITGLKENNSLTKILLPNILVQIARTYEATSECTFEIASKHFIDKIELFEEKELDGLIKELVQTLLITGKKHGAQNNKMAESDAKIFKNTTKIVLEFVKNLLDYKKEENGRILEVFFQIFEAENLNIFKAFYVLVEIKVIFDLDIDLSREVLSTKEFLVLEKFLNIDICTDDFFCMEVILMFLEEFSEVLLELQCERTRQLLANIITNVPPECVKQLQKNIKSCLSVHTKVRPPTLIIKAIETWSNNLNLKQITQNIENRDFNDRDATKLRALKTMTQAVNVTSVTVTLTDVNVNAQKWLKILLRLYSSDYITDYLKTKMAYLSDLLAVSISVARVADIKKVIKEGSNLEGLPGEKIGIQFCRCFVHVFYEFLVKKPYVLMDDDMKKCSLLLIDIVKYSLKKKLSEEQYDNILELTDKLWPAFESETTFNQKYNLLLNLNNFPKKLDRESNPLQWAASVISSDASREDKARLISVLPGGDGFDCVWRSLPARLSEMTADAAATFRAILDAVTGTGGEHLIENMSSYIVCVWRSLPARLSEMTADAAATFRAILDAVTGTGGEHLIENVSSLAGGDDTKGWWDDAMDSAMACLAQKADMALCKTVYAKCWDGLSMGVCRRLLLPLLRYSTASFCEVFFSDTLKDLLSKLKEYKATNHYTYHKSIVDCSRVFTILQMAFEKVPPSSIESPHSQLYKSWPTEQTWCLVREVCKRAVTLRGKLTMPDGAGDNFKKDYTLFQQSNYICLCVAICRITPPYGAAVYDYIFSVDVWNVVVLDHDYGLLIRHQWNQRKKLSPVSIELAPSVGTGSVLRTKMFLRTLSDHPYTYLVHEEFKAEEPTTQELELTENELNNHPCAGTLTALLCHVSAMPHTKWRDTLCTALESGKRNVKWLLAQVICNSKEELKPHASHLRGALIDVIVNTAVEKNGKRILNGLHIDILETLLHWGDDAPAASPPLNKAVELLINTCLQYRQYNFLFRTVLEVLTKFLDVYGTVVSVSLETFDGCFTDTEAPKTLTIIHRIAKSKIDVANLLPTLLDKLETTRYQHGQMNKLAEIFGLAVAVCRDKQGYLARFNKVLNQLRKSNAGEYIKMLYYAQDCCHDCCDEYNFRMTTDLTNKIVGPEKAKCLKILSTFITHSSSDYISEMFETMDLSELITQDNVEAFNVVKAGLTNEKVKMSPGFKRRLVSHIAGYCSHSVAKVRRAACDAMLAAYYDLFKSTTEHPPSKKPKTTTSRLIESILSKDVYATTILKSLASAMGDDGLYVMLRDGLSECLNSNMGVRFTECFLLCVYLPCIGNTADSVCVSLMLEMLLLKMRSQERFKMIRLRDEPLELRRNNFGPSKLLTKTRTYQGTFRGNHNLTGRRKPLVKELCSDTPDIDVQITIDSIVDSFLKFAKSTPQASQALCVQLLHTVRSGFDLGPVMAQAVAAILDKPPNQLTPFIVEMAVVFVQDLCQVDGIKNTVSKLVNLTRNTDGEIITKALLDEIKLRCDDRSQFVLGTVDDDDDEEMPDDEYEFSIDDLTTAFGRLANWNSLTLQQRRNVQKSPLPPLWASKEAFKEHLDNYTVTAGWFGRMVTASRQIGGHDVLKWLREIDNWPRNPFIASATTEAIEWQSGRGEETHFSCEIQPDDCLAEWAGRFMIRTAYLDSITPDSETAQTNVMLSRSHELVWCQRANEMALSSLVMGCVKRNTAGLYENETLPWLQQKVWALRNMGLKMADTDTLHKALNTAETFTPRFLDSSSPESVIAMQKLIIQLHQDLKTLSTENLKNSLQIIDNITEKSNIFEDKNNLKAIFELAVSYYDDLWDDDQDADQNTILSDMLDILNRNLDSNLPADGLNAIILNRLDSYKGETLREDVALKLLEQINHQIDSLDDFTVNQLRAHTKLLPSRSHVNFPWLRERDDGIVEKYKRCLQLICDSEHTLLRYCEALSEALNDGNKWKAIFDRMKHRMFENPYAGSEYQLLTRYRNKLYEIYEFEPTESFKAKARSTLLHVHSQLQGSCREVLRLSQLCPTLSSGCPAALLGLTRGLTVVRVDDRVQVITDSIRRPTKLKVLLSNGTTRFYLHKGGEPLKVDAAVQNILRYAGQLWRGRGCPIVGYNVTPLSEDSGLIEFLEDYERLRNVVTECCDLEAVQSMPRPPDQQLILDPSQSTLSHFGRLCDLVPSYSLRQGIAKWSMDQQDFVLKLKRFQGCVASSTILTWILGLGDRHLQNLLYGIKDGGLCHVDWANILQYGTNEIPPARLTANVLACCRVTELEAQLQQLLAILRDSHKLFCAVVKISLNWMEGFSEKMPHITSTLEGRSRPYEVTRQVMSESDLRLLEKQKYLDLLDSVFQEYPTKDAYDVEDQISCLLRQCTDPRILSVTRTGWEPWV